MEQQTELPDVHAALAEAEKKRRLDENLAQIEHRWLVISGKGGVGKSTVAVNLACALARGGARVGLLDVDLHGPNIAKMLGIEGRQPPPGPGDAVEPIRVLPKLKAVSLASFMADPDAAVIWRGPMKMGAIRQLLTDVDWGPLDHLVVDCPPGTGDEPLSAVQLLEHADGAIVVSTAQEVALLDSRKAVNFARMVEVPVAGIVENMADMCCPHCGESIGLFGSGGAERAAEELGVPFLGRVPLCPDLVAAGDAGLPVVQHAPDSVSAKALQAIADRLLATVS